MNNTDTSQNTLNQLSVGYDQNLRMPRPLEATMKYITYKLLASGSILNLSKSVCSDYFEPKDLSDMAVADCDTIFDCSMAYQANDLSSYPTRLYTIS